MRGPYIHYPEKKEKKNKENTVAVSYLITALHSAGLLLIKLQGFAAAHFYFSSNPHQYLWRGSTEGDPHLLVKQIKQANVSIFLHSQAKGDSNIHPYIDMFAYTDNTVCKDY